MKITTPTPSTLVDLGAHALEITEKYTTIASYAGRSDDPITECVQLSEDETYKLYVALHARYQHREAHYQHRLAWKSYCAPEHLSYQRPYTDRMHCTGCGTEHLVAHLNDSGLCALCCRDEGGKS